MAAYTKVDDLLEEIDELPDAERAELLQALIEASAEDFGICLPEPN